MYRYTEKRPTHHYMAFTSVHTARDGWLVSRNALVFVSRLLGGARMSDRARASERDLFTGE